MFYIFIVRHLYLLQNSMNNQLMMQNCFPMSRQKLSTSTHNQLIVHAVLQQIKMGIAVSYTITQTDLVSEVPSLMFISIDPESIKCR